MKRQRITKARIDAAAMRQRLDALAGFTETPGRLTRTYLSPAQKAAGEALIAWLQAAGMRADFDAVGNVIGRLDGTNSGAPALLLGSHYDTVVNAGKYDGPYGIVAAIAVVEALTGAGRRLPFPIEIAAFAEEEGVRFKSTLIGSRAVAGTLDPAVLDLVDAAGVRLGDALAAFGGKPKALASAARTKGALRGYIELHIEQGPVLLGGKLPVGVVTGIAGASRFHVEIAGVAGHAGTVPMGMRHDAAVAAAEIVLAVERIAAATPGLVGTVGTLATPGGAANIVPGRATLSLDVRAGADKVRRSAVRGIRDAIAGIARGRGVKAVIQQTHAANAVACDAGLMATLAGAIADRGLPVRHLASGAGHDAMALAAICPVAMLFVRCGNGGISHDPRETMTAADARTGAEVLLATVERIAAAG